MELTCRNFVDKPTSRMPELPNQDYSPVVFHRNYGGGTGMTDDFQINCSPVGKGHGLHVEDHDLAFVDMLDVLGHAVTLSLMVFYRTAASPRWQGAACRGIRLPEWGRTYFSH